MANNLFHQAIAARHSDHDLTLKDDNQMKIRGGNRRQSAAQIQRKLYHGAPARENFATIVPQGLPADLVGDGEDDVVERQNALIEPKGYKNEASRLPPYKPFKTVSDEDNIHLLPGETGERARQYLLDTKQVTKKHVADVKEAYNRHRENYPELYNGKVAAANAGDDVKSVDIAPPPEIRKTIRKTGLLSKLFGKKDKKEKKPDKKDQKKKPEAKKSTPPPPPKPSKKPSLTKPAKDPEDEGDGDAADEYMKSLARMQWQQYLMNSMGMAGMGGGGYNGMPGGYTAYYNPYPMGYGPMRVGPPPPHHRRRSSSSPTPSERPKARKCKKLPTQQGLKFDFMPHDDLATEITMTIEPDEPEPLQYAVENGIMPIICCYMPNSLAVSQQIQQGGSYGMHSNQPSFQGYPSVAPSYNSQSQGSGNNSQGSAGSTTVSSMPTGGELAPHTNVFGTGNVEAYSNV